MRDYVNPMVMLVAIILMVVKACGGGGENDAVIGLLVLCITAVVVNGALAVAGVLVRRPVLMKVVWAGVYFVMGCGIWAVWMTPVGEEEEAYREAKKEQVDPFARDEEGECLFTRAAALGKENVVQQIIDSMHPTEEMINEAGRRAAEENRVGVLVCLARVGMRAGAMSGGVPLLHSAAQNGSCEAMEWLILRGASTDARDEEGSTALIHAVQSGNVSAVRLLIEKGADPKLRDAMGRRALDYARSEEMEEILTSSQPASNNLPSS